MSMIVVVREGGEAAHCGQDEAREGSKGAQDSAESEHPPLSASSPVEEE
jgi:hypothetical protein